MRRGNPFLEKAEKKIFIFANKKLAVNIPQIDDYKDRHISQCVLDLELVDVGRTIKARNFKDWYSRSL